MTDRRTAARDRRIAAAEAAFARATQSHVFNAEESDYPFIANFSKGMPHLADGVLRPDAYLALLRALATQRWEDFEQIPLGAAGTSRRFTNPQAGLAFDLEGPDAQAIAMPPAPRIDSAENSSEMAELHWMALLRDVPFAEYEDNSLVVQAADELSEMSDFRGPKDANGKVDHRTLFRGNTPGELNGPYVSQFLVRDFPFGTMLVPQRQDVVAPNVDHVTDWATWLRVQNGEAQPEIERDRSTSRYLRNGRDLAHYVHYDMLYQAYLTATQILLEMNAVLDFGIPYEYSRNQAGFTTFGGPHIQTLVTEVATRALKAVWYSKWFVHRRMRPEEFGGRIHAHKTGVREFPIHQEILDSAALDRTFRKHGSYLLPLAYPEGAPLHPSYGSGHATVAGACVTVLKAWFCESFVLPDPVVPNPDGTELLPYEGERLLLGDELNKLAMNIGFARVMAGVHWRTDVSRSLQLGEEIAIDFLREQKELTHESITFTLSRFDGTSTTI